MQKRSQMPCDTNRLAHKVLQLAVGKDPDAVALGRKGGLVGGKVRWKDRRKGAQKWPARRPKHAGPNATRLVRPHPPRERSWYRWSPTATRGEAKMKSFILSLILIPALASAAPPPSGGTG